MCSLNIVRLTAILSFAVLKVSLGFCQVDPVGEFNRHVFEAWKGEVIRIGPYSVKGSPYLLGESFPGSISYKAGTTLKETKILYDLYHQKAGVDLKGQIFESEDAIESFSINLSEKLGGKILLFKSSYVFGKPAMSCFFNVLEEGNKVSLLKLYKSKLVADPSNNLDTRAKVFEQYFEYYVYVKGTSSLDNIKLRKKDLARELGDEFVNEYMSNNNPDLSKEFELIQLVKAFNSKS
jgi:hypothetical protein